MIEVQIIKYLWNKDVRLLKNEKDSETWVDCNDVKLHPG